MQTPAFLLSDRRVTVGEKERMEKVEKSQNGCSVFQACFPKSHQTQVSTNSKGCTGKSTYPYSQVLKIPSRLGLSKAKSTVKQ
jgi:hypothetical protein